MYRFTEFYSRDVVRALFASALLTVCLVPGAVMACTCAAPSLESRFRESENVFTARVTGGEVTGEQASGNYLRNTLFRVLSAIARGTTASSERSREMPEIKTFFEVTETFKGSIPFDYLSSRTDSASCGISLQIGVEYLVFAPDTGEIGLCSGLLPVSGMSGNADITGPLSVDALRAFTSGEHADLWDPWIFWQTDGACSLSVRFRGDSRFPTSMYVFHGPKTSVDTSRDDDGQLSGRRPSELSISVPAQHDLSDHPLSLMIGNRTYIAHWKEVDASSPRYFVDSDDVAELISQLVDANEVRMRSSHPKYGEIEAAASLVNAGDSVERMYDCIKDTVDGTVRQANSP